MSALERGIAILHAFTEERRHLGPTELARLTGIPRPTVTRLASSLVMAGLLKQDAHGEGFMLAAGVVSLARAFLAGLDMRTVARAPMQALAESTGGSVYLAVRDGLDMVLIEACRPRSSMLAARLDIGSRAPLATSALGRSYLYALHDRERQALLDSLKRSHGSTWQALSAGLERAFTDADRFGYCLSLGEFHHEINSVSVPLMGPNDEIMAMNCGSAAFMFDEKRLRREIAPKLQQMVSRIAVEIGGVEFA